MEEASVAGESPDSSKQRESSAEPTPGSASPVPEARIGATARDPRRAVARDSEDGRTDTATRVLSVKERPEDSEERSEEATEGATEDAVEETASSTPSGEAPSEASGETSSEPSGETSSEPSRDATSEEPAGPEEREEAEDAVEDGDSGDERLRAAVAAWVTSGPAEEPEAGDDKADAETDAPSREAEAPGADAPAGEAASDGDGAQEAPEDAEDASRDARHGTSDETEDAPHDAPGSATDADEAKGDTAPGADAGAEDTAEGDQDDSQDDSQAATEDTQDAAPAATEDAQGAPPADTEADAPPVDQPTAVFRTLKPAVDQPTTMLKLGDAKKPAPEPESEPAPEPESAAERTSRFVALKPLDDPSTRKPPPAADATTALPRVPSDKPKAPSDRTAVVPQVGPERTTQQPLPPKPPLDLLAELTNTPPPPQTPLRTAVRRVKIWTPLVLLLIVAFAIAQALRPLPTPTLELTAKESYSFEGEGVSLPWPDEGQGAMDVAGIGTMGGFGEQKPVAIGSVAKAMTAYVILKEHPLKPGAEGPQIEVDATAEKEGGYDQQGNESTLNTVKKGDKLTERQALSAIMIPSANNIARLVARWDSGSEAAFVKKMNDTAKELGMTDTTYTDPSGLKETTVSTAEDQVKLGNELVRIPALVEITKLPEWVDPSGQKWRNWNTLVPYDGAIGIKTGTTSAAGGNLLFAATKEVGGETVTVVGAILGQHTAPIIDTVNAVSKTAMLGAQEALAPAKILKKGDVVGYVDDGLGGRTPVVASQDVTAVGWAGHKVELSFTADDVPHTAKAGTKVGTLTVGDGSGGAVEVPVALRSDLAEPAFLDRLTRVA